MPEEEKESLWDMLTGRKVNEYFLAELKKDYEVWCNLSPFNDEKVT